MTRPEQQEHLEVLFDRLNQMLLKKGNDYSTNDRLEIFKAVGAMTNLPAAKVALVMLGIKVYRMSNLIDQGKTPENESLEDSSIDLIAYAILTNAILNDK